MPRASINNRKMTNVTLSNGDHVMAMRKNPEDELYGEQKLAGDAMEMPIGRPLRYTPGLRCDAHLESLRPERMGNHRAIQVSKMQALGKIRLVFGSKIVRRCYENANWVSS